LYFRWSTGCSIRNKQDNPLMPGIDVRGDGGYVLAPPSIHPSGRRYEWSVDSASEFADAPGWLLDLIQKGSGGSQTATPAAWHCFLDERADGSRRGARIARLYGYLVRHRLDPVLALGLVRQFNETRCQPPLDDANVVEIAHAIAHREAERRRGAP
jgi:hypothetical protein